MKLYQTKNVLFYRSSTVVSRLMQLYDHHFKKYRHHPRRIYMTRKEWNDYEKELWKDLFIKHLFNTLGFPRITEGKNIPRRGVKGGVCCLTFRGVPVVIDEDWKDLLKKK